MKVTPANLTRTLLQLFAEQGRPLFIVMIGAPASGKSTAIKALSEHMHVTVGSTDDQIDAYAELNGLTYSEAFKRINFKTLKRVMEETVRAAAADGKCIVIDQTNMSRKNRGHKLSWASPEHVKVAIDFDVPLKTLLERLEARAKATGKVIPKPVLFSMLKDHEAPTREEGFDVVIECQSA